ncbi:MAG: gliding motility-associated ABC transporter substrate-binding protein GldG [Ferruginibacter sp.]
MRFISTIKKSRWWWIPVVLLLAGINWLASQYHARIDFTAEKRFTLSAATKKILRHLDEEVQVDVFLKGEFPSGFRKLANSTAELLQEFREVAGKKLLVNFVSPDDVVPGTETPWGDTLSALGLYPINLKSQLKSGEQQQLLYPVALVHNQDKVQPVRIYNGSPLISYHEINSAEAMMEFQFADAIHKVVQPVKPMVAYATGNGEPALFASNPGDSVVSNPETFDLTYTLRQNYTLFSLNLKNQPLIPDTFRLLIIVKPSQPFSEEEKLKIDQFVMQGGKLLLFVDKLNAEMDSLKIRNEVIAYDRGLELDDLLFKYGARINPDLVLDMQSDRLPFDVNGNGQFEFLKWNYFPFFIGQSNHVINKNLGLVAGKFVNSIDTVGAENIKKTILLSTSPNGKKLATPALVSGRENQLAPNDSSFNKPNIPVAVLLEGKFTSLFRNRLSQEMDNYLKGLNVLYQDQSIKDNKIIVVADGDMVLNGVKKEQPLPMGLNPYTAGTQYEVQMANRNFLENCLDYLLDPSGLAEAKAKDYTLRLLDKKKTDAGRTSWQLINIAVPVLLVLLFAVIYQWWRKRKYTR